VRNLGDPGAQIKLLESFASQKNRRVGNYSDESRFIGRALARAAATEGLKIFVAESQLAVDVAAAWR
jgi:hypothetical protein